MFIVFTNFQLYKLLTILIIPEKNKKRYKWLEVWITILKLIYLTTIF